MLVYLCGLGLTIMRKIYTLAITLVIVIGLSVWVKSRWRAWFSNIEETDFTVTMAPDRVTLLPGEDFMSERTVTWRCGIEPMPSSVTLACGGDTVVIDVQGEYVEGRNTRDVYYKAELKGLQPDSVYSYRLTNGARSTRWYHFQMPSRQKACRQFVFFGDVQDTIGGQYGDMMLKLYQRYGDAEFWACAGDFIERPINKYWDYLYRSTGDSILSQMPIINAVGNHDYWKGVPPKLDNRWVRTFAYPENGAKTAMGNSYYIDFPDMRLMVLDTHGINWIFAMMGQYKWLREALRGAAGKWKVVMMHHPVFSVRKGRDNFAVRNAFKPLFDKYGVHLVLQGHEHGYLRYVSNDAGEGYPAYVVSYASPKKYKAKKAVDGMKIIADVPMYHTVEYTNDKMLMRAYAVEGDSLMDEVTIKRKLIN